ncbi:MAG: radical SAM protein [Anaerolineae bacterium]|nr:radical SAM protein [Anaerolineae bacterium]
MIAFGPVPSRRLGYSLGINHIPPKHCSYSCVYCQVGRTTQLETKPQVFYPVELILAEVEQKIHESSKAGRAIDFLSLVPDGEPTLDKNLYQLIKGLSTFRIPVAVISNASLLDRDEVQEALCLADWVSLKVDTLNDSDWHRIDRPHGSLSLSSVLTGILAFRKQFQGELVTETMIISGINDDKQSMLQLTNYLQELQPFKSYLSIPVRPPAESWVKAPDNESIRIILDVIQQELPFAEVLFDQENADFESTGNMVDDILAILAVHPIYENALRSMLKKAGADWSIIEGLLKAGTISTIQYRDKLFFISNFHNKKEI